MRTKRFGSGLIIAFWALSGIAQAGPIIYDNMAAVDFGFASDPDFGGGQFIADNFTLAPGATTIADIHWTGFYSTANTPQATDEFNIRIYADAAGLPDANNILLDLAVGDAGRVDTGIDVSIGIPFDLYSYWVDITPLTLVANTQYWLSIVNDTSSDANDNWAWGTDSSGGSLASSADQTNWNTSSRETDFQLTTVPEPTTLALVGLALIGRMRHSRKTGAS